VDDWKMLAKRYKDTAVIGVDLHNEPHSVCWGCGDKSKDWRLAAERAGNAVLSVNPRLLIIVEGIANYNGQRTWWGGNLMGAKAFPVRLDVPNRLVYSAHECPATVYPQPWFRHADYPRNLPGICDKYWGYLVKEKIAPVLIGEFGTRYETKQDKQWMQSFRDYIQQNRLSWTFWSLNQDSGGILLNDWVSVHKEKQDLLKGIQYPLLTSPKLFTICPLPWH
jgi:endoglucanase